MELNNSASTGVTDVTTKPEAGGPLDERRFTRWGWIVVLIGVFGSLLWMGLAPLDQGVQVSGTVVVSGQRKTVQHPSGGIVEEMLVREGELVKAGQVIARMNVTQARAEAELLRFHVLSGRATEARLLAEHKEQKDVSFPPALLALDAKADPRVPALMSLQQQLFFSRRSALESEQTGMDQSIQGIEFQLKALTASRQEKSLQLVSMTEQLKNMQDLASNGYVPRNRMLELERQHGQIKAALAEDAGNIGRLEKQIMELRSRKSQRQQEYQREVRSQLAEVQRDTESAAQRLASAEFLLAHTEVKSPVSGTVVGLTVFTPGAVIGPGAPLLEVVPQDAALEVEAQLPVHLVDKVRPNFPVELMFTAFNQSTTPHIPATVTRVSADRLVDEASGMPYFKLNAVATVEGLKKLKVENVRPGMPVEVFVKTGERTMLNYLIKPLFDRSHSALREE